MGGLVALVFDCPIVVRLGRICEIQKIRSFVPTLRMEATVNPCKTTLATATFLLLIASSPSLAQETPTPQTPPTAVQDGRTWAVDVHGGSYSLDKLMDAALEKHPSVKGPTAGVSLHIWGEQGPERTFRHVVAFDYAKAEGKGTWQIEPSDKAEFGSVDVALYSLTYTALWHLFPTARVNPYLGIGFGAGVWQVDAVSATDKAGVKIVLPVLYLPVGLNVKLTDRLWAHAEASLPGLVTHKWSQYYVGGVKVLF